MNSISYSAPAKVILSGEHAVVYGKPALVSAIDLRLKITLSEEQSSSQQVDPEMETIHEIVFSYLHKQESSLQKKQFQYKVESLIPIGQGMGSSAAFSVAAVAALVELYTKKPGDISAINQLAYACEKKFHGNPSGVDNTASTFGGLIFYRKEFEFLKNISSLNFKLPSNIHNNLYLIDTGKPLETTAQMVAHVGKEYNQAPAKMERIMNSIERITKRMVVSIVKEDSVLFLQCIKENQLLLEEMNIVSVTTKKLLTSLEQFGSGKITGAGGTAEGSGFVLFFAEDTLALERYLSEQSIPFIPFQQDFKGVQKL